MLLDFRKTLLSIRSYLSSCSEWKLKKHTSHYKTKCIHWVPCKMQYCFHAYHLCIKVLIILVLVQVLVSLLQITSLFVNLSVIQVIKNTGFMNGLYNDDEMVSDNVKDKDSKIAFLQKAIDMVCKYDFFYHSLSSLLCWFCPALL